MKNNEIPACQVRSEVILADKISTDPVCWPKCKGTIQDKVRDYKSRPRRFLVYEIHRNNPAAEGRTCS
jgi:hypothetical protein